MAGLGNKSLSSVGESSGLHGCGEIKFKWQQVMLHSPGLISLFVFSQEVHEEKFDYENG